MKRYALILLLPILAFAQSSQRTERFQFPVWGQGNFPIRAGSTTDTSTSNHGINNISLRSEMLWSRYFRRAVGLSAEKDTFFIGFVVNPDTLRILSQRAEFFGDMSVSGTVFGSTSRIGRRKIDSTQIGTGRVLGVGSTGNIDYIAKRVVIDTAGAAAAFASGYNVVLVPTSAVMDTFKAFALQQVQGNITVREADGNPSISDVHTIEVDQTNGLSLFQPGAGTGRIRILSNANMTLGNVTAARFITQGSPFVKIFNDTLFWQTNDTTYGTLKFATPQLGSITHWSIPPKTSGSYLFASLDDIGFTEDSTAYLSLAEWTNDSTIGVAGKRWYNPSNAQTENSVDAATCYFSGENDVCGNAGVSYYLVGKSPQGNTVPQNAIITGIKMRIRWKQYSGGFARDSANAYRIQFIKNGTVFSEDKSANEKLGLSYTEVLKGGKNDLWGLVLSPTDSLWVAVSIITTGGAPKGARIDVIQYKYYYKVSGRSDAVDSIWRTPGKDSIQFSIRGRYHAIKDSVGGGGGGGTDSAIVAGNGLDRSTSGNVITLFAKTTDGITISDDSIRTLLRTNSGLAIKSGASAVDSLFADSTSWLATDYDVSQKVAKSDMAAKLVYTARVSQSGPNAPAAAGEVNKTGQSASYLYNATGDYTLTFGAAIASNANNIKVLVNNGNANGFVFAWATSTTNITLQSIDLGLSSSDDIFTNATLQVWVDTP